MIAIDPTTHQFRDGEKLLGVTAKKSRGRWQYRMESGALLASGIEPARFVADFWYRDDYTDTP